jgi:hypothetical protein
MRNLLLLGPRDHFNLHPGDFALTERTKKPLMIGNYLEVLLYKKLGVVGEVDVPGCSFKLEKRAYEFIIHHSAIHGALDKEMEQVRYETVTKTQDMLLRRYSEGDFLQLRSVLVCMKSPYDIAHAWYVIAVNGEYLHGDNLYCVPSSNFSVTD